MRTEGVKRVRAKLKANMHAREDRPVKVRVFAKPLERHRDRSTNKPYIAIDFEIDGVTVSFWPTIDQAKEIRLQIDAGIAEATGPEKVCTWSGCYACSRA